MNQHQTQGSPWTSAAQLDQVGVEGSFFASYQPLPGIWDECHDGRGLRADWRSLGTHLDRLGPAQLDRRWDQGRRLIRENGLAFQAHASTGSAVRPWSLDPLPLMIGSITWQHLAEAVAQRARLLNAALADAYGPQRMLLDGVVPAAAVLAHPHYLRPCRDVPPSGGAWLHLYACDLARGPDGAWRVLADHTQTPPGAGFALENRLVLTRTLAEPFRDCRVERLAPFFQALRACLNRLAPPGRERPRIGLLTPGPGAETYFEQAYLAQYLGYDLVQGDDLTVREGRVLLKTLGGLVPVDVLLRRLADEWCDPLELRSDSSLGVLGLVGAARSGGVGLANALGAGLAENPAWLAAGPELSRRLLGEELRIAPIATAGGAEALAEAMANPSRFLIRPAFANRGRVWQPDQLDEDERRRLVAELECRPHGWIRQEHLLASTAPTLIGSDIVPRHVVVRLFAVRQGDSYLVMTGGLARTFSPDEARDGWLGRGGGSKDVWALAEGAVPDLSLLPPQDGPIELRRGGPDLPSRVADNLFWLGRYAERVEDTTRLLRSAVACLAEDAELGGPAAIEAHVDLLRRFGQPIDELDAQGPGGCILLLAADPAASGLGGLQGHLRRTAAAVRDRLSADTWRALAALDPILGADQAEPDANQSLSRLNGIILACAALAGMGRENTTRGPGWRFLDLGRRLERATFTADLLNESFCAGDDPGSRARLEALLSIADSAITYRSRYRADLRPGAVLDLLGTDTTNPRSLAFQVDQIRKHVEGLPRERGRALPSPAARLATRLADEVMLADPDALAADPERLGALLTKIADDCATLAEAVTVTYLAHSSNARQGNG